MRKPSMQHLTIPEIKALLREVPVHWQRVMLLVALCHGLRVSELIELRGENIQHGRLYCERKKRSLPTKHPFWKSADPELDLSVPLTELAKTVKLKDRLFPMTPDGVLKLMKRAGGRAGIDPLKLHPHALKHSCVRLMLRSKTNPDGAELVEVKTYVGHASIQSTALYTIITMEDACDAVAGKF